jgi:hypothetical protein
MRFPRHGIAGCRNTATIAFLLTLFGFFAIVTIEPRSAPGTSANQSNRPAQFFMFTTSKFADQGEREAIFAVLRKHLTTQDYLGVRLARVFPELGGRIGPSHQYALPPSLKAVDCESKRSRLLGAPGLVIYDAEHWPETPADEQADIVAAISRGKVIAAEAGCHEYGIAPDGWFIGIPPRLCTYDLSTGIYRAVDWRGIALFNIQAQRLLSDECSLRNGVDTYVGFVTAVVREVRDKAPQLKIVAQLSFRFTPPDRMIAAIERLRRVVDGFYIAYPSNVGPPCAYCSPMSLEQVLAAIRV